MDNVYFCSSIGNPMYLFWLENNSLRERISCRWHNYRMAVEFIFLTYYVFKN